MIFASLPISTLFRMLSPRWAFQPLSGAGAARQGGRFNRPGQQALYLSFSTQTDPGVLGMSMLDPTPAPGLSQPRATTSGSPSTATAGAMIRSKGGMVPIRGRA